MDKVRQTQPNRPRPKEGGQLGCPAQNGPSISSLTSIADDWPGPFSDRPRHYTPCPNIVHIRTIFRHECKSIGKPRSSALFVSLRIGRGLDYLPSFWIAHATQQLDQTEVISADKS